MFAAKNELLTRPSGYFLTRSLRFRASATAYLNRTFSTPTSSTIYTWSGWVKRGTLSATGYLFGASTTTNFGFNSSNNLVLTLNGTTAVTTTAVYRDPAAWYHVVYQQNGSAQTIYVNGVSAGTGTTAAAIFNTAIAHQIAAANTTNYFDGYMAEVNFIDGQALTPSSFGASSPYNQWLPKKYAGTYGTNGFYLPFTNNASAATLGNDFSGNSNTWTTNNISVTTGSSYDSTTDVPTLTSLTAANYAVLNPLDTLVNTLTNGNLYLSTTSASYGGSRASIAIPTTGKWYWETTVSTQTGTAGDWVVAGMGLSTVALNSFIGQVAGSIFYGERNDLAFIYNETTTVTSGGSLFVVTGDVMQCAYDASTGKFWFGKNNTWWSSAGAGTGNPSAGTNNTLTAAAGTYFPFGQVRSGSGSLNAISLNFGQQPFAYTPPTGFVALNTFNL